MQATDNLNTACQRIRINGVVQGVGFRPFIWRLAKELELTGWVRNDSRGVEIEACGKSQNIEHLIQRLHKDAPPFARIDTITSRDMASVSTPEDFFILDSRGGRTTTMIGQDTTICRDCLSDMFEPNGRRWRYAFTNCGHCGPRYTICRDLPFDRERTSLKPFTMCSKCQTEYQRPHDRRQHAEDICCPKCGPHLSLVNAEGKPIAGDAIANAYALLKKGQIVAIKGPGGFHLACDAHNAAAVARLRERKHRYFKPFPVMFANALSATSYVQVSVGEPGLLNLPERPIILLRKRGTCDTALPGVAPDLSWLGVVLPFSPIHYLIFHEAAGRPPGMDWLDKAQNLALLMCSANPSREPPTIDNAEALLRLNGIADAFLMHNRDIVTRCDDSVAYSGPGGLQLVRRSRGYAPRAIKLSHAGPPVLAVGSPVKNTICITRNDEAFVSQHIGELINPASCQFFEETIAHLLKMLQVSPALIAHDLCHNDYLTKFVSDLASQRNILMLGVQHHHAHIASILAEHHVTEPVISIALDVGEIGPDGKLWGGELLRVDGARFERLGHLTPFRIVGDKIESNMPWHLAASMLHALGRSNEITQRFSNQPMADQVIQQLSSGNNCQESTSMGRLFGAAAGILGVSSVSEYRDQSGLLLEGMAERFGEVAPLQDGWRIEEGRLDLMPLFSALADEKNTARGAAIFHATVAAALTDWLCSVAPEGSKIAAGGSCLQNQVLARELRSRLVDRGLRLIEARRMPPNDGGLALGQAWVAQQYLQGWGTPEQSPAETARYQGANRRAASR